MKNRDFKHDEAFSLILYDCKSCKNLELYWNSRDGVIPFATTCNIDDCSGVMHHSGSLTSLIKRRTLPSIATMVWVDVRRDKVTKAYEKFFHIHGIEKFSNVPPFMGMSFNEIVEFFVDLRMKDLHGPMSVTVSEYKEMANT